jgi:hypothetical protein
MQRRRKGRLRHSYSFVGSLALHAALLLLVSVRACAGDASVVVPAPSNRLVDVELASLPPPPLEIHPTTARPGGGVPNPAPHAPPRKAERPNPQQVALAPEEPHGREVAVPVAADAVAAPSRPVAPAPPVGGPPGSGPGAHGGPGGPGAGPGGPPLVSGDFPFGGATAARFRGVACFIPPGTLRIADVRGCVPVATFYTNTFDVHERQEVEGFPGIADRASWFMIEYTGVFTVARDGSYAFRLHSDDGSYLFIDGQQVIDNDGKHEPWSRRGSIQLTAGEHHLKLLYAQTTDRMALQLYVRVPGGREELFTPRF